jgi:FtsP/CotA-like multicopper oxidase with cupredoxin domain
MQPGAPGAWLHAPLLSAALLASVASGALILRPPAPVRDPIDLGGLPAYSSHDGVLKATLVAAPLRVTIGGTSFPGAGFNGVYAGPVLRAHPGDRVEIHVVNHMPDTINLHYHGMRISPLGHGDNMQVAILPGQTYDYAFLIPPNHPPGLFWYHDHAFEAAERHVNAGLSGAILIDGFAAHYTGLQNLPQKLLVLKDWTDPACTDETLHKIWHCRIVSINGGMGWQDSLPDGGAELWRVNNEGANLTLHLSAPGLTFRVVGRDGLPATEPQETDHVDILPAARADFVVRAATPGTHKLLVTNVLTGSGASFSTERQIGTVTASGVSADNVDIQVPPQQGLRDLHIDAYRTIRFTEDSGRDEFFVNDKLYDPARTDYQIPLGSVEEWTVRNETDDFHEFHIHQTSFDVTEINGVAKPFTGFVDDVSVPTRGEVKVRIPFTDPIIVGHIMFHCHVLKHEDHGMMAMVEVVQPGQAHICRPADTQGSSASP